MPAHQHPHQCGSPGRRRPAPRRHRTGTSHDWKQQQNHHETKTLMFGFHVSFCLGCRGFKNIPKKESLESTSYRLWGFNECISFSDSHHPVQTRPKKTLDITSWLPWLQTFKTKHPTKNIMLLAKIMFPPTTAYSELKNSNVNHGHLMTPLVFFMEFSNHPGWTPTAGKSLITPQKNWVPFKWRPPIGSMYTVTNI